MHWACAKNNLAIAKELVDAGASKDKLSTRGGTILHEAASSGSVELVQYILDLGVDPYVIADDGSTALSVASKFQNEAIISILESITQ